MYQTRKFHFSCGPISAPIRRVRTDAYVCEVGRRARKWWFTIVKAAAHALTAERANIFFAKQPRTGRLTAGSGTEATVSLSP